jgi:hypothetical protein
MQLHLVPFNRGQGGARGEEELLFVMENSQLNRTQCSWACYKVCYKGSFLGCYLPLLPALPEVFRKL